MDTYDVAVIGLGFAGLPTAVAAAGAGLRVVGIDSAAQRVHDLNNVVSGCGLRTVPESTLANLLNSGQLHVQMAESFVPCTKVHVVCVPTPSGTACGADLTPLLQAVDGVAARLRRGDLVLVQSTCPPGTVEQRILPRLQRRSGLAPGSGFGLAYSPVRVHPGNDLPEWQTAPRVVAGATPQCRETATRFLRRFTDHLVPVGSPLAAELIKVFENTFRLVNISLANELAAVCRACHIAPDEVLQAAGTKPFGFLRHQPSVGAGGDCIPVSAGFFAATARRHGMAAPVVEAAIALNEAMPEHTIHLVRQLLATHHLPALRGEHRVLAVGVTYRPDVASTKRSAAVRVLEQLRLDVEIAYHDPYVPDLVLRDGTTLHSIDITPGAADLVLLLTRHEALTNAVLVRAGAPVVDCSSGTPRLLVQPSATGTNATWTQPLRRRP